MIMAAHSLCLLYSLFLPTLLVGSAGQLDAHKRYTTRSGGVALNKLKYLQASVNVFTMLYNMSFEYPGTRILGCPSTKDRWMYT